MTRAVLDELLDELAERLAAKVLDRLAAPAEHYGTGRAATLPPGKSRAWALRMLKTIPGARKVGRDWVVSIEDFDAWASEQDTRRCAVKTSGTLGPPRGRPTMASSSLTLTERADRSLAASGFRRTR